MSGTERCLIEPLPLWSFCNGHNNEKCIEDKFLYFMGSMNGYGGPHL